VPGTDSWWGINPQLKTVAVDPETAKLIPRPFPVPSDFRRTHTGCREGNQRGDLQRV